MIGGFYLRKETREPVWFITNILFSYLCRTMFSKHTAHNNLSAIIRLEVNDTYNFDNQFNAIHYVHMYIEIYL